eukprot:996550_1
MIKTERNSTLTVNGVVSLYEARFDKLNMTIRAASVIGSNDVLLIENGNVMDDKPSDMPLRRRAQLGGICSQNSRLNAQSISQPRYQFQQDNARNHHPTPPHIPDTDICPFVTKGQCSFGNNCKRKHISPNNTPQRALQICSLYGKGQCKKGDVCKFQHVGPVQKVELSISSETLIPSNLSLPAPPQVSFPILDDKGKECNQITKNKETEEDVYEEHYDDHHHKMHDSFESDVFIVSNLKKY